MHLDTRSVYLSTNCNSISYIYKLGAGREKEWAAKTVWCLYIFHHRWLPPPLCGWANAQPSSHPFHECVTSSEGWFQYFIFNRESWIVSTDLQNLAYQNEINDKNNIMHVCIKRLSIFLLVTRTRYRLRMSEVSSGSVRFGSVRHGMAWHGTGIIHLNGSCKRC